MNNKYNKIQLKSEFMTPRWLLSNGMLIFVAKFSSLQMSLKI
jgi:hypothetical protein